MIGSEEALRVDLSVAGAATLAVGVVVAVAVYDGVVVAAALLSTLLPRRREESRRRIQNLSMMT
jgi:hypothetical protein